MPANYDGKQWTYARLEPEYGGSHEGNAHFYVGDPDVSMWPSRPVFTTSPWELIFQLKERIDALEKRIAALEPRDPMEGYE